MQFVLVCRLLSLVVYMSKDTLMCEAFGCLLPTALVGLSVGRLHVK